jgi:type I restriction enzyme, S subunit
MRNWPLVRLGEIAEIKSGSGFPLDRQGLRDQPIPFFKVGDMNTTGNESEMHVFRHSISEETRAQLGAVLLPAGTVIFPKVGAAIGTNKKRVLVRTSCVDNNVMGVLPCDRLAPGFLFALLAAKDLTEFASNSNPPSIRKTTVEDWRIPIPPLVEQRSIVRSLNEANELKGLRGKADRRTAALIPALFAETFGDPEQNPKGWPSTSFEEVISSTKLGLVRGANEMDDMFPFPYIRMDAILGDGNVALSPIKRVKATATEVTEFSLRDGDFLFNTRNSRELVGKTGLFEGNTTYLFNNNIMRLRFNDSIDPRYMIALFQTDFIRRRLESRKSGTTSVVAIYFKNLREITVRVPPLSLQKAFAQRVTEIRALDAERDASRGRLDDLFQSMLHGAFSGEI